MKDLPGSPRHVDTAEERRVVAGPAFVIETSAAVEIVVVTVAVAELFPGSGSPVTEVTVAVFATTVPRVALDETDTTRENTALPTPSEALEHETVPPAPTAGVEQDQPPGEASETNVVAGGSVSDSVTEAAASEPKFVTVMCR